MNDNAYKQLCIVNEIGKIAFKMETEFAEKLVWIEKKRGMPAIKSSNS